MPLGNSGATGQLQIFVSEFVLEEARRNMVLKRPALLPRFEQFRPLLPQIVNPDPEQLEQFEKVRQFSALKDPDDAPIIAGAMKAQAEYLATYDKKHLLSIKDEI